MFIWNTWWRWVIAISPLPALNPQWGHNLWIYKGEHSKLLPPWWIKKLKVQTSLWSFKMSWEQIASIWISRTFMADRVIFLDYVVAQGYSKSPKIDQSHCWIAVRLPYRQWRNQMVDITLLLTRFHWYAISLAYINSSLSKWKSAFVALDFSCSSHLCYRLVKKDSKNTTK